MDLLLVSCVEIRRGKHSLELGGSQQFEDAQRSVDYFHQPHINLSTIDEMNLES